MPDEKESGRTAYNRLEGGGEGERRAVAQPVKGRAGGAVAERGVGGVSLVRTLVPLLVGFVLLIGLVFGLGTLSDRQLRAVSFRSADREGAATETLNRLNRLRLAMSRLDNEARSRAQAEARGGLRPPGDFPLGRARDEVREVLPPFDAMPLAQTEKGLKLRADIDEYIEITKDPRRYSLEGFEKNRSIEQRLGALYEEVSSARQSIREDSYAQLDRARRQINFLKWLAVLTGLFVAAATTLEVLRRFGQLRRSFEEVRRERQFSRQMLEGMVSAIAAVDGRDRLRSANASFFRIFPEARLGESLHDSVEAPESLKLLASATSTRVHTATYRGRWRLALDAREHAFDVYSSPLEIEGEPGQILTLVDVTEAAESERELRRREALTAVGQAAAQLAHEIKNPLGSIRLGVAMLRDMSREREAITTIDLVERGIEHLSKLTSDVTQFSRRRQLRLAEVELHELLDESLELIADRVQEKGTPIEREFSDEQVRATWDEDQLRQVFVNLLANAVDASPPRRPVTITTSRVERSVGTGQDGTRGGRAQFARVEVADRGAGMEEEVSRRVFEPFFTTKKKGTGLGLAIAKQIVEAHGGHITVASRPGEGTRFTVELPFSAQAAEV